MSVIIPVHNGERFLQDAVAAVLAQRYPSVEIIIVVKKALDRRRAVPDGSARALGHASEPV